jgi:hypothetical protein
METLSFIQAPPSHVTVWAVKLARYHVSSDSLCNSGGRGGDPVEDRRQHRAYSARGQLVRLYVDMGEIDPNNREAFRLHTQETVPSK